MAEDRDGIARAVAGGARGYLTQGRQPRGAGRHGRPLALAAAVDSRRQPRRPARRGHGHAARPDRARAPGPRRHEPRPSNAEIGRELYLSEDTVKTHARRLFRKLGAADRAQAVALGFRWGFVR